MVPSYVSTLETDGHLTMFVRKSLRANDSTPSEVNAETFVDGLDDPTASGDLFAR